MHMTSEFLRRAAGLALAAAVISSVSAVRVADKRIVLIAGKPSHPPGMHEFRAGCLLFQKALASSLASLWRSTSRVAVEDG